jgi:hypothetical protein
LKALDGLAGSCDTELWTLRITDERRFISAEIHFMNMTVGYILCTIKEIMRTRNFTQKKRREKRKTVFIKQV